MLTPRTCILTPRAYICCHVHRDAAMCTWKRRLPSSAELHSERETIAVSRARLHACGQACMWVCMHVGMCACTHVTHVTHATHARMHVRLSCMCTCTHACALAMHVHMHAAVEEHLSKRNSSSAAYMCTAYMCTAYMWHLSYMSTCRRGTHHRRAAVRLCI